MSWRKYGNIYNSFQYSIKKELKNGKVITYKIKFIDSFIFMSSSLSSLVDNLSEGFTAINAHIEHFI